jgi:hypothetical protein
LLSATPAAPPTIFASMPENLPSGCSSGVPIAAPSCAAAVPARWKSSMTPLKAASEAFCVAPLPVPPIAVLICSRSPPLAETACNARWVRTPSSPRRSSWRGPCVGSLPIASVTFCSASAGWILNSRSKLSAVVPTMSA